jgi:hypothetical protein
MSSALRILSKTAAWTTPSAGIAIVRSPVLGVQATRRVRTRASKVADNVAFFIMVYFRFGYLTTISAG